MDLRMFDFKNFFKNHFLLEANIGESPETAVLIDNDDLDFLYQMDYQYWKNALHTRYEVLLDLLKSRDNIRKSIEAQFINSFNSSYPTSKSRQQISLESFIEFVNNFAAGFNDYGQRRDTPIGEKAKFKYWEKDFREEYADSFDDAKKSNSRDFLKNIRYMILDYIVPFVLEKSFYPIKFNDKYVKDEQGNIVKAKFFINRLIQKLETNQGKEIILPDSARILSNLSKVLVKKEPIEMDKYGKYGFDMSKARVEEIGGAALGKTRGFTFPQLRAGSSGLTKVFNNLMRLNYQRHMGDLPSDENFDSYADMRDEGGNPSLIYKKLSSKSRNLEDNLNLDNLKISIKNKIKNVVARNRTDTNWSRLRDKGLYSIIDKKFIDEIESGSWAGSDSRIINHILQNLPEGQKVDGNKREFVMRYVSQYQKVSGNTPILNKFAQYFSTKQVETVLASKRGSITSPRILDGEDYEQRRINFSRLDPKLRKQIEENLSKEEIEFFIKTGRLPLSLKAKKLIPGKFTHPPIILPFLKTTGFDGNPISVPLIRPGKYLSGFEGIGDGEDEVVEYEEEEPSENSEEEKTTYTTPSTSDRTSFYINNEDGEEKEIKIIDAQSSERYSSKTGSRGAYYTTRKNERGYGERRFGFSRWKQSDKIAFLKVFSHPEYKQDFSLEDVITKYEQLFGKEVYDEVFRSLDDPESFYENNDLIDGFPFKLAAFRIAPEDERSFRNNDDEDNSNPDRLRTIGPDQGASRLTIKPDKDGDIIGFPYIIRSIVKCLTLKTRVCNNDGFLGYRIYYFEDPDRVQELHDKVLAEAVRTNIWKNFTSKTSATNSFCSIIGKLFQSDRLGQHSRKKRLELIGHSSNEYFKKMLSDYKSHLDEIKSKESKPTTNRKKLSILDLIDKVIPLGEDDDDDIVEWFFPGYKDKSQKEKGQFISEPKNFSPTFADWNKGQPPTKLKDLVSLIYENFSDGIPQEFKEKLIEKIKSERDYLVGTGRDQGVLGVKSYIWNQSILNQSADQIQSFHEYIKSLYDADMQKLSDMPSVDVSSDYEEEEEEKSTTKSVQDVQELDGDYLKRFASYFNKLAPILIDALNNVNRVPYLRSNLTQNPSKSNKAAEIISVLDIVLNANRRNSVVNLMNFLVSNIEAPSPQIYKTTIYEKEFIKENKDSKSSNFLNVLYNISISLYKLADAFNEVLAQLEKDINDPENRGIISNFIKQNFGDKESSKLFLVSNIYRNNARALDHYGISYIDVHVLAQDLFHKLAGMNKPSVLRRIDMHRLSSGEDVDISKLSSWQLIKLVNSKESDKEKSTLASKIKSFYLSKNRWESAEPFFKRYIDSKILPGE